MFLDVLGFETQHKYFYETDMVPSQKRKEKKQKRIDIHT